MVLTQRPSDYGIERQMWTGAILSEVIAQQFEVQLKDSRIYEVLEELGLSYQRAHRDYEWRRPTSTKRVGRDSKKKLQAPQPGERTVFFDEFAVYDRPSLFYGWAERNTRPEVKSDERRRNKLNGLLCIDAVSGEEFFRLSSGSKTEDVSEYLAELCLDCVERVATPNCALFKGNNPTHKQSYAGSVSSTSRANGISQGNHR